MIHEDIRNLADAIVMQDIITPEQQQRIGAVLYDIADQIGCHMGVDDTAPTNNVIPFPQHPKQTKTPDGAA